MNRTILLSLFFITLFSSCKKEEERDTQRPVISNALVDGEDHDIELTAGLDFRLTALVNDDRNLGQFKVDIHDDFDGHDHGRIMAKWADVIIEDISGTEANIDRMIPVPQDALAGPYHMILRALDAEGNESEFVQMTLIVKNGSEPMISVNDPDLSVEFPINRNDTLSLVGTVVEDVDLTEVLVSLRPGAVHDHGRLSAEVLFEKDFDLPGSSDTSWDMQLDGDLNIPIPADAEVGDYTLLIVAKDSQGNLGIFEAIIEVI